MRRHLVIYAVIVALVATAVVAIAATLRGKTVSETPALAGYQPKPIPAKSPVLHDDHLEKGRAFNRRMTVEAYKKYGRADSEQATRAGKFLEDYVAAQNAGYPRQRMGTVAKQGQQLIEAGYDDPLLLTCVGISFHASGMYTEAGSYLRKGLALYEGQDAYPAYCASLAPKCLILSQRAAGKLTQEDSSRWTGLAIKWMAKAMADGSFLEDEMILKVAATSGDSFFSNHLRSLCNSLDKQEGADPYIRNLLLGTWEVQEAWASRGSGWAADVSDEGWTGFEEHLEIARKALTKAWKQYPQYPEAPAKMIAVAMAGYAGPGETCRMWFDRAVAAQWDYEPAYNQMATALLPRWGGNLDELYAFGEECLRTKRFDSSIPWFFTGVLRIIQSEEGGEEYYHSPKTVKLLNQMFDGYEKTGFSHTPEWYKSARAAMMWYWGDVTGAKRLLEELNDKVDSSAFYPVIDVGYDAVKKSVDSGARMWEPVKWNDNGHYYQMCRPKVGTTWDDAKAAAEGMTHKGKRGHLATFDTVEECSFVSSLPNTTGIYLIGALKPASSGKSRDGWSWVTGEPWEFGFTGDPMQGQDPGKDLIAVLSTDVPGMFTWHTLQRTQDVTGGYIVEYE